MTDPSARIIACLRRFAFHSGDRRTALRTSVAAALTAGNILHWLNDDAEYQILTECGVAIICGAPASMTSVRDVAARATVNAVVVVTATAMYRGSPTTLMGKPLHVAQVGIAEA
jgi:hypothetical protein